MSDLASLRRRILRLDEELLRLWKERDEAARRIGKLKHTQGLPLQNFEVEKTVLEHAVRTAEDLGLSAERTRKFVRLLIESSLAVQEQDRVRVAGKRGRTALVVGGAGLMGSWFARFLEEQGFRVFVDDPRTSPYPKARSAKAPFDLILLATPPSTIPSLLKRFAKSAPTSTLVVDIASIKGAAVKPLKAWAKKRRVASLHPMFGPGAEVLMGRNVLVLDCGNPEAAHDALALFSNTAATTHLLPLDRHDPLMAEVLGLSHATSIAFNEALRSTGDGFGDLDPYGSTTFRKQVEVSREVARENPDLYFEIQRLNPHSRATLARLAKAVDRLRRSVATGDAPTFRRMMKEARGYYEGGSSRSR